MSIHPTAIIDSSAELAAGVEVGPYSVIGPHVKIGEGTVVQSHVTIERWTTIGQGCRIRTGAKLGGPPQDRKYHGERSFLVIGDRNEICEDVTIHRATGEENVTRIGSDNLIMAYVHIGHNCQIGSGISMATWVGLSGHTVVEDRVVFGGMVGVHQYVRVGKLAMVGGMSKVVQDIPPFMMADGRPTEVVGLNVLGLRRGGVGAAGRAALKQAFRLIYRSGLNLSQAIEAVENEVEPTEERDYLLAFVNIIRGGYGGRGLQRS